MVRNEEELDKEEKTGMYLRISALIFFFMLCMAGYYVVLPRFFPAVVRHNIVDPAVLLPAYYACDDEDLRWRLRRRYMRYAGEDLTDRALEEIAETNDEQRRMRAIWLLTKSNKDKCYEPLAAIFNDKRRSEEERYTAIRVLTYIGQLETAERQSLFKEVSSGHELCVRATLEETSGGVSVADAEILRSALRQLTLIEHYSIIDLATELLDDQDFIAFWRKVPSSLRHHHKATQRLQQITNGQ